MTLAKNNSLICKNQPTWMQLPPLQAESYQRPPDTKLTWWSIHISTPKLLFINSKHITTIHLWRHSPIVIGVKMSCDNRKETGAWIEAINNEQSWKMLQVFGQQYDTRTHPNRSKSVVAHQAQKTDWPKTSKIGLLRESDRGILAKLPWQSWPDKSKRDF